MRRVALLLTPLALLAGCNAQPAAPTVAEQEAAMRNAAADLKGWDRVFDFPAETIGRLNQFGYRLDNYRKQADGSFAAKGAAITLSQSDAATPNRSTIAVTGKDAAAIDRIVFALPITDDANADTAKQRLTGIVRAFLFQYGVKDEAVLDAIAQEQKADRLIGTALATVAIAKDEGPRRITVTFQRPPATAQAETAVQNNQQP